MPKQIKVNDKYSVSRSTSQYICTFHAVESEGNKQDEVIKTFPCLLSMYEYLTENGHDGSELLDVISPAHREITPEIIEECTKDINNYE